MSPTPEVAQFHVINGIGILSLDSPPVNALSAERALTGGESRLRIPIPLMTWN
jgi:hypothetical protein